MSDENNDGPDFASEEWWLATVGNLMIWARMRVRESGTAEILDCDGRVDTYDSEETARAALMDADFRALDGLDDDDADLMGFDLDSLEHPRFDEEDPDALRAAMTQRLPPMH